MAKGTKLSEFEEGEITALKRVGKSQREILKDAVKLTSAIIWKVKISMKNKKKRLVGKRTKVIKQTAYRQNIKKKKKENVSLYSIVLLIGLISMSKQNFKIKRKC